MKLKLKKYNTISNREISSVVEVMQSGSLSPFVADFRDSKNDLSFYGGKNVKQFEKAITKKFGIKYAISVNSWTSGLIAAVGALDIEPGDEIITSPFTMSATAACILHWSAIPIFADIDPISFNLDIKSVESKINKKTKAIIIPEIFGNPVNANAFIKLKRKYNIKLISDTAQAITAKYNGKYSGTTFDIGGFSLNYNKHIQTGEGGIVITNNKYYAKKIQLIRNHAEVVVKKMKINNYNNLIGFNFRLGEIEAAIGIQQLKKIENIINFHRKNAQMLINGLKDLRGLQLPYEIKGTKHVYYYFAMLYDEKETKVKKNLIVKKLKEKNIPVLDKYQNINLLPTFSKKIAFGKKSFPWSIDSKYKYFKYGKNDLPITKDVNKKILALPMCKYLFEKKDIETIIDNFKKIWKYFNIT